MKKKKTRKVEIKKKKRLKTLSWYFLHHCNTTTVGHHARVAQSLAPAWGPTSRSSHFGRAASLSHSTPISNLFQSPVSLRSQMRRPGASQRRSLLNPLSLFGCSFSSIFFHFPSTRFILRWFHLDWRSTSSTKRYEQNVRSTAAMHLTIKLNM